MGKRGFSGEGSNSKNSTSHHELCLNPFSEKSNGQKVRVRLKKYQDEKSTGQTKNDEMKGW